MNCRTFASPWGNEDTQTLINILEKYHVKTTFFVVGDWAEKYPESVKALHDAGHEVMSHSNHHDHYNSLSAEQITADITASNERISAVTGVTPTLIRCPYGEYDDHVIAAIRAMGMEPIQWDVDSLDWKDYDADTICKRVTSKRPARQHRAVPQRRAAYTGGAARHSHLPHQRWLHCGAHLPADPAPALHHRPHRPAVPCGRIVLKMPKCTCFSISGNAAELYLTLKKGRTDTHCPCSGCRLPRIRKGGRSYTSEHLVLVQSHGHVADHGVDVEHRDVQFVADAGGIGRQIRTLQYHGADVGVLLQTLATTPTTSSVTASRSNSSLGWV